MSTCCKCHQGDLAEVSGYSIVRCSGAGVFYGEIEVMDDVNAIVVLRDARQVWRWDGAATIMELSQKGTSKPSECKFPDAVPRVKLYNVIQILPMTVAAKRSLDKVAVWTEHD